MIPIYEFADGRYCVDTIIEGKTGKNLGNELRSTGRCGFWDSFGLDHTQTGPALSLDTDTHDKTKPKDSSHQKKLPAGSPGNLKNCLGVVAPEEALGVKMGDPAILTVNGKTIKCVVIDRSTNTHSSHTDKPEAKPAAAKAAGKGGKDVPASIFSNSHKSKGFRQQK